VNKLIAFLLIIGLAGCATTYRGSGFSGGYSETQLGEDTFQVSFNGNGYTGAERAADFALLRSAEVAAQHGFPFFVIVNAESASSRTSYTTPTTTTGSAYVVGNTVYGTATTTGGQTFIITKPSTRNTIIGLKTKPQGFSYEARYIIRSLRDKYKIPGNSR
jgi:hypothetical protein